MEEENQWQIQKQAILNQLHFKRREQLGIVYVGAMVSVIIVLGALYYLFSSVYLIEHLAATNARYHSEAINYANPTSDTSKKAIFVRFLDEEGLIHYKKIDVDKDFPADDEVAIYYDRTDPNNCTLKKPVYWKRAGVFMIIWISAGLPIMLGISSYRKVCKIQAAIYNIYRS